MSDLLKNTDTMTSLQIAEVTGKRHCDVLEAIRTMEPAWAKVNGRKFPLVEYRLFEWLRRNGYLCSKGEYYNQPTQRAMEMGLFEVKKTAINKPDGSVLVSCTTKVTGKGQVYFVNKFLNQAA